MNLYKIPLIHKAAIAALWIIYSGFTKCNEPDYRFKNPIYLRLSVNYPIVQANNNKAELFNLKDTIYIFYHNTDILYYIPHRITFETEEKLISEEVKYFYFLYTKDSSFGYFFDSSENTILPKRHPVDSFLFRRGYASKFDLQNERFIGINKNKTNGVVTEKYVPEYIPNETCYDTIMFYFDKRLNDVSFSFSKNLDKVKRQKLFKVRLLYNQKYSEIYQLMMPQREMYFEIQKLPIKNPKTILKLINQLKNKIDKQT
ncbi:MAG TPA: hypothetical protein VFN30_10840 [Chitinophagaceae bacterium]|nr:hypothetical protein [Chitinophagaceae bacterium]